MKKLLIITIGLLLLALVPLVCSRGAPGSGGAGNTAAVSTVTLGPSTGDAYILDGDGCPDGYTFVRDGGSFGDCTFNPQRTMMQVYCNGEFNRNVMRYEIASVDTAKGRLRVFWPGGAFACVRER